MTDAASGSATTPKAPVSSGRAPAPLGAGSSWRPTSTSSASWPCSSSATPAATLPPTRSWRPASTTRSATTYSPRRPPGRARRRGPTAGRQPRRRRRRRGLLAIELFLAPEVLVNELALRPHDCGHLTIDACPTLAIRTTPARHPRLAIGRHAAAGTRCSDGQRPRHSRRPRPHTPSRGCPRCPQARVRLCAKIPRPGRKLGHVTALGETGVQALHRACSAAAATSEPMSRPIVGVVMGSDSGLPVMSAAAAAEARRGRRQSRSGRSLGTAPRRTPHDMLAYTDNQGG